MMFEGQSKLCLVEKKRKEKEEMEIKVKNSQ